ncbi:extracellular solute-binding protein [Oceanibium sediminis]|uniref:extracellular solute-binding protein n=1 Tax=Oceanibium sediminis TaxID=2026339 RepID=UPI000DD475BC|nr:extracellular solute-binding protein [Oceanibium sediminis]
MRIGAGAAGAIFALLFGAGNAVAEPQHGISMYGEPALPPDFVSLPYANPDAPKGGRIVFGEGGGYDAFNPYILKGRAPWGLRVHVYETLLGRSYGESFTLYGLLAESVETGPEREWVEFQLREEAAFSDGTPLTVDDVIWSFETLAEKGLPRYQTAWDKVASYEKVGERGIRFTFSEQDNELPLILGLRPILNPRDWDGRDFAESSLDVPTATGPYTVGDFEPGRFIEFQRNPDYWGKDLPFNAGLNNFDTIRYEYFADGDVIFEAFRAGETSTFRELNPARWASEYNFPAVQDGRIVKSEIPHSRPSGMEGFVFNTRRPLFQDWRVREALIQAFNFEFINQTLNGGVYPRRTSYFSNSFLGMDHGPAEGEVRALLEPFAGDLLPGALEGYSLPTTDGGERNRANLRRAAGLMEDAGWSVQDGVLKNADGQVFSFTILVTSTAHEAIANLYIDALKRLGVQADIAVLDNAQYRERRNVYDYDVIINQWGLSLSPGNEQTLYWGSNGVTEPGTRNYMGMDVPAAEAMIETMLTADDRETFVAAVKALDRVLMAGRYVVPFWHQDVSYLAHKAELKYPETLPIYGDWLGFLPEVWWSEAE